MPDFSDCPRAARYTAKAGAGGAAGGAAALVLDALTNAHVAMLPGFNFGLSPEALVTRMAFVDFDGGAAIDVSGAGYHSQRGDNARVFGGTGAPPQHLYAHRTCRWHTYSTHDAATTRLTPSRPHTWLALA